MTWFRSPPIPFQLQEIIEEEHVRSINTITTVDITRDVVTTCSSNVIIIIDETVVNAL